MTTRVIFTRPSGEAFEFDAWLTGNIDGGATITEHPIEDGSIVGDHAQALPKTITLSLRHTETPIDGAGMAGVYGPDRVRDAFRFLEEAGTNGEPLEVEIPRIGVYETMVLQAWPAVITAALAVDFEVTLKQITIAHAITVEVPVEAIAPTSRAGQQESVDVGKQATDEKDMDEVVGDNPADVPPSLMTRGARSVRGWFRD